MRTKKITAILIMLFMLLTLNPVSTFAEESDASTLEGELYIVGSLEEGGVLYPEFSGVLPGGLDGYEVYYYWSRCVDGELIGVSQNDTYIVTAEDVGCQIVLTITGREDLGYYGSLSSWTEPVYGEASEEEEEDFSDDWEEDDDDSHHESEAEETEETTRTEDQTPEEGEESTEPAHEDETREETTVSTQVVEETTEATTEEKVDLAELDQGEGSEARVPVPEETTAATTEEVLSYRLESDYLDLGTFVEGYSTENIVPVSIVIINDGTKKLTFDAPSTEYGYLDLGGADGFTVAAGDSVSLSVYPVEGLDADIYDDVVYLAPQGDILPGRAVHIDFRVMEASSDLAELLNIEEFEDAYISNGTPKSAESFGLPTAATVQTTKGAYEAAVYWDVEDSEYDPYAEYPQSFAVSGVVVLPEDVVNTDEVDTSVFIMVYADGRQAYYADADSNGIYGIDSTYDGYTTSTKLSFSAYGAGMDDADPVAGDTRYLPVSWEVLEARGFADESFSSSFRIAQEGGFTLSVTYNEQMYDGYTWQNTGEADVKEVSFHVAADPEEEEVEEVSPATAYANEVYATISRGAVQTADDTPLGIWIAWLLLGFTVTLGITLWQRCRR